MSAHAIFIDVLEIEFSDLISVSMYILKPYQVSHMFHVSMNTT